MADAEKGEGILREKVDDYKKAHPENLPELDYALFLKSLEKANDSSPIKVARNAFNEKREWIPGTETHNVSSVFLSEDHCVTFVVSHGDRCMTAEQLREELDTLNKKLPLKNVPVMLQLNKDTTIQATDLYAHSLVTSSWAGLPVDFVLCYTQKKKADPHPVAKDEQ